ncbi:MULTISPECIES: VOC family protein [Nocardia]|uniref:VOC family protein n=1 Tax=Nocardia TaxID=1817 RepID=UPI000D693B62|nr:MULTISPECIES: VOC family protein [Nocardia]
MQILKTYARLFVRDLDTTLPTYEKLVGAPADLRFAFEEAELAAVGDFLLIAGPPEATDRYRTTLGPVVVDDLDAVRDFLAATGCTVIGGPLTSATGRFLYARHHDGNEIEYVEWTAELRARVLGATGWAVRNGGDGP